MTACDKIEKEGSSIGVTFIEFLSDLVFFIPRIEEKAGRPSESTDRPRRHHRGHGHEEVGIDVGDQTLRGEAILGAAR